MQPTLRQTPDRTDLPQTRDSIQRAKAWNLRERAFVIQHCKAHGVDIDIHDDGALKILPRKGSR